MSSGSKLINRRNSDLNLSVEERLNIFERKRMNKLKEQREKLEKKFLKFKSHNRSEIKNNNINIKRNNEENSQFTCSQIFEKLSTTNNRFNDQNNTNHVVKEDLLLNQDYNNEKFKQDFTKNKLF